MSLDSKQADSDGSYSSIQLDIVEGFDDSEILGLNNPIHRLFS